MWVINSIKAESPKRIKKWFATRKDPDDTGIEYDYTIENIFT